MTDTLYFYAQADPYAEFSNFAPFGVEMEGVYWRTVEHYFQAMKFNDASYREKIRASARPTPSHARFCWGPVRRGSSKTLRWMPIGAAARTARASTNCGAF